MIDPPEVTHTDSRRVRCDGADAIRADGFPSASLGHPRVWLEIDGTGYVDCGYCDRRFVLNSNPAERGDREVMPGDLPAPGDASVA